MSKLPLNSLAFALLNAARINAAVFAGQSLADGLLARVDAVARPAVQDIVYGSLRAFGRGDLLVSFIIKAPKKLGVRAKKILEDLEREE